MTSKKEKTLEKNQETPKEPQAIAVEPENEHKETPAPVVETVETGGGIGEVVENKNAVVPEAVAKAKEKSSVSLDSELVDSYGEKFNPDIHITDAEGKPVINRDGFITRKRGRKKGTPTTQKIKLPNGQTATVQIPAAENEDVKRQQAAYISAGGFINIGVMIFGEEWLPEQKPVDEHRLIVQAFDDYYKVKGVADIPPGVALVIALGGYGIKRLAKPNTKTKFQLIVGSVIERAKGIFNRLRGKKSNGAHVDSRNNPNGKNDPSGRNVATEQN